MNTQCSLYPLFTCKKLEQLREITLDSELENVKLHFPKVFQEKANKSPNDHGYSDY